MIHYRNGYLNQKSQILNNVEFEERYKTILSAVAGDGATTMRAASKYYRDGYNLYKRMKKYKKDHLLLFLHNKNVPATNNEAERLLRKYKKKTGIGCVIPESQVVDYLCKCMSMLV